MKNEKPGTPELQFELELDPNWEEFRKQVQNALIEYAEELQQHKEDHVFTTKQNIKEEGEKMK